MKVFISHQRSDSDAAGLIAHRLKTFHQIDSYLDVIDPNSSKSGDELGDYIRLQMTRCTQLMAVVSGATKLSWWVPWEIGVATEKDFPISTFAKDDTTLPDYLKKWPYLRSMNDVDAYAQVSKTAEGTRVAKRSYLGEDAARRTSTGEFHRILKSRLGQY
jgi:hypothetical protein